MLSCAIPRVPPTSRRSSMPATTCIRATPAMRPWPILSIWTNCWRIAEASFHDRHRAFQQDRLAADPAAPGDGLDPGSTGAVEGGAIGGIDVAGERKPRRRADLHEEEH